jgi:hypothetical protein
MKNFLAAIFLLPCLGAVHAQNSSAVPANIRATNVLNDISHISPNELLYGIPLPPKNLVGDAYLNSNWQSSNILLFTKETLLEGYRTRYDLLKDELEVDSKSGIKVLEGKRIKSFVWLDSVTRKPAYFINASQYKDDDNTKMSGFFSVEADGKLPLFKRTTAYIKKADYNVQFNVGSRDDKVIKKEELFYAKDNLVYEVPKSKKKLLPIFGDRREEVEQFIKSNSIDVSDEGNLKRIFTYYNSLQ